MTTLGKRFANAYGRLCHFVAIRKDIASVTAAEDGVIRAAIYLCENAIAPDSHEIGVNAKAFFSLSFSNDEIDRSIDRLQTAGQVVRRSNDVVALSPLALADIEQCVNASTKLETDVRLEWLDACRRSALIPDGQNADEVWSALQHYLAAMFTRHGLQTLEILSPESVPDDSVDSPASQILDDILGSDLSRVSVRAGRKLLQSFLRDRTPLRTRYLSELLDGTFSFFALTVDDATRELVRQNLPPLKLFVDTNFIFGLLELHSNPFVAVSKQLADLIREQDFPFQLYYHPITAIEFRSVIDYYHRRLAGRGWSSSMSRTLLRVGELSSVERKFHELNADAPITLDDFFVRYSNLDRLLAPAGIRAYRSSYEELLNDSKTLDLISRYKRFLNDREKPFDVMQHDIILWRTLQAVRQNHPGPFGAGAFFLTCDYRFWRFDHRELSRGSAGVSVLPNVLLQLLRPFVPRTEDFDRGFVSTFALPEFRTIHSASAQAVSRVAGIVRLYSDLPEEVAVAILTDDALIAKVTKLDESDPSINELIESAIAAEAGRWKEEAERLREQLTHDEIAARETSVALFQASQNAEQNLKALDAVSRQLEEEKRGRQEADAAAAEERGRNEALRITHDAEASAFVKATEERHIEQARHSREMDRLKRSLYAIFHVILAFALGSSTVRYLTLTVRQFNAVVVGATMYGIVAAVMELMPWFRRCKQRPLARVLWLLTAVLAIAAAWCGRGTAQSIYLGVAGSAMIAAITALFQRD